MLPCAPPLVSFCSSFLEKGQEMVSLKQLQQNLCLLWGGVYMLHASYTLDTITLLAEHEHGPDQMRDLQLYSDHYFDYYEYINSNNITKNLYFFANNTVLLLLN